MRLQVQWNIQEAPKEGEVLSGDRFIIKDFTNGYLVCVIDGLGHGKEANKISNRIIDYIESLQENKWDTSLSELFTSLHKKIQGTRGAVMSSFFIEKASHNFKWVGVGNVEGIIFYSNEFNRIIYHRLINQDGVIGLHLPNIRVKKIKVPSELLCILYTDGLSKFGEANIEIILHKIDYFTPEKVAKSLFSNYRNPQDDTLIWIGKFLWN